MEGRVAIVATDVHVGALVQQQLQYMLVPGCIEDRSATISVEKIEGCSRGNQCADLQHAVLAPACGQHDGPVQRQQ
jgi:hypothetical protein